MHETHWHIKPETIERYLSVCRAAITDDNVFNNFRNDPFYTAVCEHTSEEIGRNCYEEIKKNNKWLLLIDELYKDRVGNPEKIYQFGKNYCPASIMQYVWQVSNIINKIGSLHDFKICEIGGGYGGLCRIIKQLFDVQYTIIDLPEVIKLQKKYLNEFGIEASFNTSEDYDTGIVYDLIISNYALSEVGEPIQTKYLNEIVYKAKHGYLTINRLMQWDNIYFMPIESKDIKGEAESNLILQW